MSIRAGLTIAAALLALLPRSAATAPVEAVDSIPFRIHAELTGAMDLVALRQRIEEARVALQGFQGAPDHPCCTRIEEADFASFGAVGDGLDVIENESEFQALQALGPGAYIVRSLLWCGAPGAFLGCAPKPGGFLVLTLDAEDVNVFGEVLAHERAHNAGLDHVSSPACNLMLPGGGGGCLSSGQCSVLRSLAPATGDVCACHPERPTDPPQRDGVACSDAAGAGLCSGGLCGEALGLAGARLLVAGGPEAAAAAPPDDLLELSPLSGGGMEIGALGLEVNGMAYASERGELFAVAANGSGPDRLLLVDPASGATSSRGLLDRSGVLGLAWDPAGERLIGVAVEPVGSGFHRSTLLQIDPNDAAVSEIGVVDLAFAGGIQGLALDPVSGTLYGATSNGLKTIELSPCQPFCPTHDVEDDLVPGNRSFFGQTALALDPNRGWIFGLSPETRAVASRLDVIDPVTLARSRVGISGFTPGAMALAPLPLRLPVCSDGNDNDGDGRIDYPADPGCLSPEGTSELEISTPQSRDQQKCINGLNRDLEKLARRQGKEIRSCLRDGADGALLGSVEGCLVADRNGKLLRAAARTQADERRLCSAAPPDFGPLAAATVNAAATEGPLALTHSVLGPDLDVALIEEAVDREASRCQRGVMRRVERCRDVSLQAFNRCKKLGLSVHSITKASDLDSCLADDAAGKIAKACDPVIGRIAKEIARRCGDLTAPLSLLFPVCATDDPVGLAGCLDAAARCSLCRALRAADGLTTNCDAFDNGLPDLSCP